MSLKYVTKNKQESFRWIGLERGESDALDEDIKSLMS